MEVLNSDVRQQLLELIANKVSPYLDSTQEKSEQNYWVVAGMAADSVIAIFNTAFQEKLIDSKVIVVGNDPKG